jgi:hypothetical protein
MKKKSTNNTKKRSSWDVRRTRKNCFFLRVSSAKTVLLWSCVKTAGAINRKGKKANNKLSLKKVVKNGNEVIK